MLLVYPSARYLTPFRASFQIRPEPIGNECKKELHMASLPFLLPLSCSLCNRFGDGCQLAGLISRLQIQSDQACTSITGSTAFDNAMVRTLSKTVVNMRLLMEVPIDCSLSPEKSLFCAIITSLILLFYCKAEKV